MEKLPLNDLKSKIESGICVKAAHEELELLEMAGNIFSVEAFLAGDITPVFFCIRAHQFRGGTFL